MSFEALIEGIVLAGCVLASLTLIGTPLRLALQKLADEPLTVPSPLIGMGVVVVAGWYWYGPFDGVRPLMIGLALLGLGVGVFVVARTWAGWRTLLTTAGGRLALAGMVAVGVGLLLVLAWGSLFSGSFLVNATGGNNDMASYALLGQHVADSGPGDVGSIVGYDAGLRSQASFDFGSLAIIAASSIGPFDDVWRYQMPLAAVTIGLIAYVLARLFDTLAPGHRALAAIGGVAAVSPILFAYLWSQYFLNELLAISLVLGACAAIVRGAARPTGRARVAYGLAAGVVIAGLFASYPHMALAGPLVFVPALFVADGISRLGTRLLALVVQGIGSLVAAVVMFPTPAWRIPEALQLLSGVEAGWPLPGYLPAEILGFVSTMSPRHDSWTEWIPSIVILAAIVATAVWAARSRNASALGRFGLVVFGLSLGSYWYAFESQGGPSYRQWKWITFFTPVLVGTAVMLVTVAVTNVGRRFSHESERIALAVGVAYCTVVASNAGAIDFGVGSRPSQQLTTDLVTLGTSPALRDVDELNVAVGPYWETMWVSYFLRDREALRLEQPSYYTATPAMPGWTLQRLDAPTDGALEVRPVNDTYVLVRR